MLVLHPSILALGALAAAVPIIIHLLLKRRKPPMAWGAMRFVLEAYRRTRRRSVERWLLLVARVLLLLVAGLVLARPVIGRSAAGQAGAKTLWIVLDDSIASQAKPGAQVELARSIERAQMAIDALATGDRAALVLASGPARGLVVPPSADLPGVRAAMGRVEATDAAADWAGALAIVQGQVGAEKDGVATVLLASAWREGSLAQLAALGGLPPGVSVQATEPIEVPAGNTSVRAARASRPVLLSGQADASQTVSVDLRRSDAGAPATTRVRVMMAADGTAVGEARADWSAGQREASVTVAVNLPATGGVGASESPLAGVLIAEIEPDAIAADNRLAIPLLRRDGLRVGLIEGPGAVSGAGDGSRLRAGQWARLALRPSESAAIEVVPIEPGGVDAARLAGLDALWVLSPDGLDGPAWSRVAVWHRAGGLLIVSPPAGATNHLWTDVMNPALGLNWTVARSAVTYPADAPGRVTGAVGAAVGASAPEDLLAAVRGEMDDLARPVGVLKVLAPDLTPPPNGEASHASRVLLATQDGRALVTALRGKDGPGVLVYLSVAPDAAWSDLVAKPLMVPLVQELVRQGVGVSRPGLTGTAGVRPVLPANSVELRFAGAVGEVGGGDVGSVRSLTGGSIETIRNAGLWRVIDAAGAERGVLAINAASDAADTSRAGKQRVEAALATLVPPGGVIGWGGPGGAVDVAATGGTPIGTGAALLWIVLGLLVVEGLLGWLTGRVGAGMVVAGGSRVMSAGGGA